MEKSHVGMYNCFYCNEAMGILLDRRLKNSLPMNCGVLNSDPCDKCKGYMEQGIILVSIRDDTPDEEFKKELPNPYRTGGWVVVTEEAVRRYVTSPEILESILKRRFSFISDEAWNKIGLPREESK